MATSRADGFKVTGAIWNALFTNISDAGDYTGGESTVIATSPNITYSSGTLNVKKIGRWVWVTGFVAFPATANGSQAEINNLPYTAENNGQARGGGLCHYHTLSTIPLAVFVLNNSTRVQFINAQTTAAVTNATLTGQTVFLSFNYRTTS